MALLKKLCLLLHALMHLLAQCKSEGINPEPAELMTRYTAFKQCCAAIDQEVAGLGCGCIPSEPATHTGGSAPAPATAEPTPSPPAPRRAATPRSRPQRCAGAPPSVPAETETESSRRLKKDKDAKTAIYTSLVSTLNGLYSGSTHAAVTLRNILLTALVRDCKNKVVCPRRAAPQPGPLPRRVCRGRNVLWHLPATPRGLLQKKGSSCGHSKARRPQRILGLSPRYLCPDVQQLRGWRWVSATVGLGASLGAQRGRSETGDRHT
jgi:hypothetical protein